MPQTPHPVLAIGDLGHADFERAMELVRRTPRVAVLDRPNCREPCELVLAFQQRSGSVDTQFLESLHERMPLAGKAVVLGTWCEGEARTGKPLNAFERVFWYQFPTWWSAVRDAWSGGGPTHWQRPSGMPGRSPSLAGKFIAIDSGDADAAGALLAACESLGGSGVWHQRWRAHPQHSAADAVVWVGAQLDEHEQQQLADCRSRLGPGVPLVVLLDFPRSEVLRRAEQLGATAVLGKPWRAECLAAALTRGKVASV